MIQNKYLYISILLMMVGFLLNVVAWTILPGPNLNTISLLLGLGLMFGGFISFYNKSNKK